MKHILEIDDLTPVELEQILDLGIGFSSNNNAPSNILENQGVALLFEKASLRTRHSLEMAVVKLGGHPVSVSSNEIGIGSRESASDVAKTLSQYHTFIGARVFEHQSLVEMAAASSVPVFNLLSDLAHPLQAMADLLTIKQDFGKLEGIKLAYIGDANNVAHSLALAATHSKMSFSISHPEGYGFAKNPGAETQADPISAVADADVVYTDVWTSMGQEREAKKRQKDFKGFCVTAELMAQAKPDAKFMHCLPAHRGEEVAAEVIDGKQSLVWQQAQNRMYSAMGLLNWLYETTK